MKSDERFVKTYHQNKFGITTEIWVDKETGVNYLYHGQGYGGGITVLMDKEGKPIVTNISDE